MSAPQAALGDHEHRLPPCPFPVDRLEYLLDLCRGRRVLHVGCADDTAMVEKLAAGRHLHGRLREVAHAVGVDLAFDRLVELHHHGLGPLLAASALAPPFRAHSFDDLVLGEILEHLPDPGAVLRSLRESEVADRLIVTVPNAYSLRLARRLGEGVEVVNPDHLYTFTPVTLGNLLRRNGWDITEMRAYAWTVPTPPAASMIAAAKRVLGDRAAGPANPRLVYDNVRMWWAYRMQPFRGDGLIAVAR